MIVVGVLACSKRKGPAPAPARELYRGDVFRLARRYLVEREGAARLIVLSALHGAVPGEQILAPYECALAGQPRRAREDWAARTAAQLRALVSAGARVVAIVPHRYAGALRDIPHERRFAGRSLGWLRFDLRHALARAA